MIPRFRIPGSLWVLLGVVGVLLGVLGPVERSVSEFEVLGVGSRVDVALPLSDRSPELLSLGFTTLGRVPVGRVSVFSSVARDVAWDVRSAGGLVVAFDADGVWLGAKDEWVRVGGWSPFSSYELKVRGDRSARLTQWSSDGGSVVGGVGSGGVPLFEVTGLHARGAGLVEWGDVRVVSSPSEDHRPSVWMLLGYVLVVVSAIGIVVSEGVFRSRRNRAFSVRGVLRWCQEVWWLWVVVFASILLTPPSHTESWVIGDLRVSNWVRLYDLGEYVTSPFGGLFYFLLGMWSKIVVPVWLLRLPVALLFVVAVVLFSRRFVVDRSGVALPRGGVVLSVLVVLISVLGQGEWLRPEIPILSLWMLAVAILSDVTAGSGRNGTRIVVAGLLAGMAVQHPMGLAAAASIGLFAVVQLWTLASKGSSIVKLTPAAISAGSLTVVAAMFGHSIASFLHATERFAANSPAHSNGIPIVARLEDLSYFPMLFRFILPLCLGSLSLLVVKLATGRVRLNSSYAFRLLTTLILATAVILPSGPWGIYFAYLAPLTSITINALAPRTTTRFRSIALSTVVMVGALGGVGLNWELNYRFLVAPLAASLGALAALTLVRPATIPISFVMLVGVAGMVLPGVVTERFETVPLLNRKSLLNGELESASEYEYQETSFATGRMLGYGQKCGFLSQWAAESQLLDVDLSEGHVAYRYGLHSPCTRPPSRLPNQEGLGRVIHTEPVDMLYFQRVLAALLEHRYAKSDVVCMSRSGPEGTKKSVLELVRLNAPQCVIRVQPFPLLSAHSVVWKTE